MTQALILTALCALPPQSASAALQIDPTLIRVHVRTDDSGDATDLAARRESVRDLAAAIGAKKKVLVIVADEDTADIVLEVMDRGVTVPKVVFGVGPRPGQRSDPGALFTREVQLRVTLELARAEDSVEIKNKNRATESSSGWKSAADDVAKQVEKWIADRRAKILALRARDARAGRRPGSEGWTIAPR